MANPEGYRKALRLMRSAEKFGVPVVCLIDTPGAYPGIEAEQRGQGEAIARNILEMTRLKVPIIVVIIGEGASGGALGIGVGDVVLMLENTWYSVISPGSTGLAAFRVSRCHGRHGVDLSGSIDRCDAFSQPRVSSFSGRFSGISRSSARAVRLPTSGPTSFKTTIQ